ncbi:LuxR C-terminal-related transcriptional regulator [Massilia sp. YIM B02443]|uniref:LuxR C-terminal-related transcriptional regulator n=1 Tax=Massilia sp. YIM B02443 TaxID=3050127 RepID=UPI0025B69247|nr:LuxR C-terminal-related transcriptional regulator [Massilia sp. YIM B02443]MDN4036596.1 LuxR C-terminal-related transcriptional regulator [Massilia sp. YIM B02443]
MTILTRAEQEYLLRTIESGMALLDRRQLFLWAQGPLQALLPHDVLLCIGLDGSGRVLRVECLHRAVLDAAALERLTQELAPALAQAWRAGPPAPLVLDGEEGDGATAYAALLRSGGCEHALVHGCVPLAGPAGVFVLLGMPSRPEARHGYFLQLLLPYLHLALLRLPAPATLAAAATAVPARALSARERAILERIRDGRTNEEVALQLGISALTVKNHLQRVYRVLGVGNRAHAVARCLALRLL